MYVTYFDEIKYDPSNGQNSCWIGAISVNSQYIPDLEMKLSLLSEKYFGTKDLSINTEFHGKNIYGRKANFKGWPFQTVLELYSDLFDILSEKKILKIIVRIDVEDMFAKKTTAELYQMAFVFLIEKTDELMQQKGDKTILIGDYDDELIKDTVKKSWYYRRESTPWAYGRQINSIIDTVHFARSHHCRLIQLADIYLYAMCFYRKKGEGYMVKKLQELINWKCAGYPNKYKIWPPYPLQP